MGIFSKIKNKIRKAIPKEVAPFLPAIASIYGGPMLLVCLVV
jgi:Mg2+/citrate symporter